MTVSIRFVHLTRYVLYISLVEPEPHIPSPSGNIGHNALTQKHFKMQTKVEFSRLGGIHKLTCTSTFKLFFHLLWPISEFPYEISKS